MHIHKGMREAMRFKVSKIQGAFMQEKGYIPGACNKCPDLPKCHLDKYFYKADAAHEAYRETLVESRIGINLTEEKRKEIGQTIAPLLKQGQSVYQILSAHGEIDKSIRAVYGYIESGVFKDFGVDNFSLKEQVSRKRFKRICKPRKKKPVYEGRLYKDLMDLLVYCLCNQVNVLINTICYSHKPCGIMVSYS